MAEGPGCVPCAEGWHTARVKWSSSSKKVQRSLGSSACRKWPMQALSSSLEWHESTGNPAGFQHLTMAGGEHHWRGGKHSVL